jgi:hypothetical protein
VDDVTRRRCLVRVRACGRGSALRCDIGRYCVSALSRFPSRTRIYVVVTSGSVPFTIVPITLEASMKLWAPLLALSLLVASTGCGKSSPRMLQSVTASPTIADAQNFPNGQVQFTPTGVFNKAPTRVTPLPACSTTKSADTCITAWSTSPPDTIATVDQTGVAHCLPGQSGTVTIAVAVVGDGPVVDVAKLTCP